MMIGRGQLKCFPDFTQVLKEFLRYLFKRASFAPNDRDGSPWLVIFQWAIQNALSRVEHRHSRNQGNAHACANK
jgi:hypothetical protein